MRIAICDDGEFFRIELAKHMKDYFIGNPYDLKVVKHFQDGESLLEAYQMGTRYDILFLDVRLSAHQDARTGVDFAEQIRKMDEKVMIIFVTSLEHVKGAASVGAFDYLNKPVEYGIFAEILDRCINRYNKMQHRITWHTNHHMVTMLAGDIVYIQKIGKYLHIQLADGNMITVPKNINEAEQEMKHWNCLRCHRRYMVHLFYIEAIHEKSIHIKYNGHYMDIPVSKKYLGEMKKALLVYKMY